MRRPRVGPVGGAVLLATLALGCATPPRPRELDAYDALKKDPNIGAATKRSPDLVTSSDKLGAKANDEWQSNDLEESRRDALMAQIKLKTALSLAEQDRLKAKIEKLSADQAAAEEELASVSKDLASETEKLTLLQKYLEARKTADADKQRLAAQMSSEQQKAEAEQQRLSQQLATEQKIAAAQLSLRTAETVDAAQYASAEYRAASDMLGKAQEELKSGAFAPAQASADVAKKNADHAAELAKPKYEQAEAASQNKARDDSLSRDATGIPGVTVRSERRGDLQRLVVAVPDLFVKKQTTLAPGHESVLDGLAQLVNKYPTYPVQVVGHTDNRGKSGELVAISAARAQAVYSALVSRGVEARRLMPSGVGGDEPMEDNHSASGRAKNNRVEIVFLYH
ncbi:MAG TPA: OmpA family protein [Polyangia bacterium]|nr:OmpA family protein [Polyangia bacterium]